jgi:hypothetical protein
MGIAWTDVKFLAQTKRDGFDFTRTLTIGRLRLYVGIPQVQALLEFHGVWHTLTPADVTSPPVYAEPVFAQLGAQVVDSIDASDYEGATIVADLNRAIPPDLNEKYDVVFDGGSLEHVFNVPQALANVMSMPKVGGSLIIHTMANNCFGHGFYQFSPELFYRVLTPENGYRVVRMVAHLEYEFGDWYEIPDPAVVRSRIELANPWDAILLFVHAQRVASVPLFTTTPQQSDYAAIWQGQAPRRTKRAKPESLKRRMIKLMKRKLPWAVRLKHQLLLQFPAVPRFLNGLKYRRQKKRRFSLAAHPEFFRPVR